MCANNFWVLRSVARFAILWNVTKYTKIYCSFSISAQHRLMWLTSYLLVSRNIIWQSALGLWQRHWVGKNGEKLEHFHILFPFISAPLPFLILTSLTPTSLRLFLQKSKVPKNGIRLVLRLLWRKAKTSNFWGLSPQTGDKGRAYVVSTCWRQLPGSLYN